MRIPWLLGALVMFLIGFISILIGVLLGLPLIFLSLVILILGFALPAKTHHRSRRILSPKKYIDEHGYERGDLEHSDLIHRQTAYRGIYLRDRSKYPLPFGHYEVHHIDNDKRNNRLSNLRLVARKEHEKDNI